MTRPEHCARCGQRIWQRTHPLLRLCAPHTREHLANQPPHGCTPADLEAVDSDGAIGLLYALSDLDGWILSEGDDPWTGRIFLQAESAGRFHTHRHVVHGDSIQERALAMFKRLFSDDPLAISIAADLWPPPPPTPQPTPITRSST